VSNNYFIKVLLVLILSVYSFAQKQEINISGFIRDSTTGSPLIGTNILLYKDSLNLIEAPYRGAVTNQYGFYAIPNLNDGLYYLVARYLGYKTTIREINIGINDKIFRYDFVMTPEDIKLDEVVIEGKVDKGITSTIDVPTEILNKLPSLSGEVDLFRALQLLPGVKVATEISNGLYVRGGSPDQMLTLLDGVIIYNPAHLGNFASTFNSNALKDIRLIKGAFPAEYGGRLSSVLDIKLRSGTKEKNKGIIGLGTINTHATLEGPLIENSTYMISGRSMYYDLFQKKFSKSGSIPRYNFYDINSKIYLPLSKNSILSINGLMSKDKLYSPPSSDVADYDIQWENTVLSLNWIQITSKSIFLNSSVSYIDYKFKSIIEDSSSSATSSDYFSSSNLVDFFFRQNVELYWHQDNVAKLGLDVAYHSYDLIHSDFYDEALEKDPFVGDDISALETSFYLQNESQITAQLKTNIGGRFYYFKNRKYFSFEPRVSAAYALTDELFIKGAYAEAHQFLHLIVRNDITLPTDLWYPSTSNILPSKSFQYVVGIDRYFSGQEYLFSLEGYYKKMKNLYQFIEAPKLNPFEDTIEEQFTKGEGEAYGLEFFFNKGTGNLTGWIGYTLSWTKRKFEEINLGRTFYPRYDRRHDMSLVVTYKVTDNLNLGATWVYSTGAALTLPTGQYQFPDIASASTSGTRFNISSTNAYKLPSYHKLDLSATYKFVWLTLPFEAYLNIYNVYNRKNAFARYVSYRKEGEEKIPELKEIILFPFIPTIGINVRF
jgi:outer membrane cobalamin receptor